MRQKSKKNRSKQNRRDGKFLGRTFIVCIEIFVLVVVVGVSLVLVLDDEERRLAKQLRQAGASAELLIGTNVSEKTEDHNLTGAEAELSESRYGEELADEKFCEDNRIYAMPTISADEITLAFAGDVSFAEEYTNMEILRQRGGDIRSCFDEFLLKEMQDADILMLNNEFPYTDRGTPTEGKSYTFRAHPESVKHLYDMGVDIVSVANNHVYDYGEVSLLDTLATLETAAMPYVGAGRDIEDALTLGIIGLSDMKELFRLSNKISQGTVNTSVIMHEFIVDIVKNSTPELGIGLSSERAAMLNEVKAFNYAKIYRNPKLQNFNDYAKLVLNSVFKELMEYFDGAETLSGLEKVYSRKHTPKFVREFYSWVLKYCDSAAVASVTDKSVAIGKTGAEELTRYHNIKCYGDLSDKAVYTQAILDFVSGMTDKYAIQCFEELISF